MFLLYKILWWHRSFNWEKVSLPSSKAQAKTYLPDELAVVGLRFSTFDGLRCCGVQCCGLGSWKALMTEKG